MHSSRMHTGHSLTISRNLLLGGVCSKGGLGVSVPGGVCSKGGLGVSVLGGLLWGVSALGGGCLLQGSVCSKGVSAPGGLVSQHALRQTPPC